MFSPILNTIGASAITTGFAVLLAICQEDEVLRPKAATLDLVERREFREVREGTYWLPPRDSWTLKTNKI
jgi:hypothetical protein